MLLYYHSWMFYIHFIETLYHFLGLTYWHSSRCKLLFFFLFFTSQNIHIKRSPNTVKLFGDFFGPEDNLGTKEVRGGRPVGPIINQGTQESPCVPWWIMGPIDLFSTASQLYKYPNIPETLGESMKHNSRRRKFQNYKIQSRHHHRGVHHPHWCASDDAWVVHSRPTGP